MKTINVGLNEYLRSSSKLKFSFRRRSISRRLFVLFNVLVIVAALLFAYVTVGFLIRQMYFAEQIQELEPDAFLPVGTALPVIIAVVQLVGIVVGLKFMSDVRSRKIK